MASSAAIHAGRAYLGTFGNEVLGIDLDTGEIRWRYAHAVRKFPFYSSPAVADQAIVIGGRDKLVHALDPQTGQLLWTFAAGARVDSSPVIAGDYIYVGARALIALALASGAEVWRFENGRRHRGFTGHRGRSARHWSHRRRVVLFWERSQNHEFTR